MLRLLSPLRNKTLYLLMVTCLLVNAYMYYNTEIYTSHTATLTMDIGLATVQGEAARNYTTTFQSSANSTHFIHKNVSGGEPSSTRVFTKLAPHTGPCTSVLDGGVRTFDPTKKNDILLFHCYPLDINTSLLVQQVRQGWKPDVAPLNTYIYTTRLKPKCGTNESVFMVYLIKSRPGNVEARNVIRETWGKEDLVPGVRIKRVFLLGLEVKFDGGVHKKITQEHEQHNDVLQDNFADIYMHTRVKMTAGLRWATSHCSDAEYLVLADDDVMINPWRLVNLLSSDPVKRREQLYMGVMNISHTPFRNPASKWHVSVDEYPFAGYPPFGPTGTAVLNMRFAQDFIIAWQYIAAVRFDDVFLGIVAKKLGVEPFHTMQFRCAKNSMDWTSCFGEYSPQKLLKLWPSITKLNRTHGG